MNHLSTTYIKSLLAIFLFCSPQILLATEVNISNLQELAHYAALDGNVVTMEPGTYRLVDYLSPDDIAKRREEKKYPFFTFSGSDNELHLEGVTIVVDTDLRQRLNPPIHSNEFIISGDDNQFSGLTIQNIGDGTSPGGAAVAVTGNGNTLRDWTLTVRGSYPYGYGDLFGKGGPYVIAHRKHSGLLVTGNNTRILGCKIYMRSFGHGFFVQGGNNHLFQDCYVEGEMRSTDDMLAETSGPAFEANFRTVMKNRDGEAQVTSGYMKSLCEDGYRTYGQIEKITFKNCTAKNTRAGFELRTSGEVHIENCTTIGTERGYWVSSNAVVRASKGDAQYGPLLFLEGNNASVELELMPTESDKTVHALATIHGNGHQVTLKPWQGENRNTPLPICLGYTQPPAGEAMSPYGRNTTRRLHLRNETTMPVIIAETVSDTVVTSRGSIVENRGEDITLEQLQPEQEEL